MRNHGCSPQQRFGSKCLVVRDTRLESPVLETEPGNQIGAAFFEGESPETILGNATCSGRFTTNKASEIYLGKLE